MFDEFVKNIHEKSQYDNMVILIIVSARHSILKKGNPPSLCYLNLSLSRSVIGIYNLLNYFALSKPLLRRNARALYFLFCQECLFYMTIDCYVTLTYCCCFLLI